MHSTDNLFILDWFRKKKKQSYNPSKEDIALTRMGVENGYFILPSEQELEASKYGNRQIPNMHFKDYIDQTKAKNILQTYIKKFKGRALPHILIHGNAGCGKTTLARTIAGEHNVPFLEVISKSIMDAQQLVTMIKQAKGGIVFIDEIHGLKRDKAEVIYSMMEDFKYNGEPIEPFTLIGATTEYGELLRSRRPFVDRFKLNIELEPYNNASLERLIRLYRKSHYVRKQVTDEAYKEIACNSRLVPRMAIRLLDNTICFDGNYKKVFSNYNIVKDGYTTKDIKTLAYLSKNKTCGIDSISSYLNIPRQSFLYEVEPYLLQTGLIVRKGTGRSITSEGIMFLSSVQP